MRFRFFLFDLDGTLVNSAPDLHHAINRCLQQHQLPPVTLKDICHWMGAGSLALVQQVLQAQRWCGAPPLAQETVHAFHQHFLAIYTEENARHCMLYDGVASTLTQLCHQGVRMAIVSNKPAVFIPSLLQKMGIADFFDVLIGGDTATEKKPHPTPLLLAMQTLNATPSQTVMVGDSCHDVQAARAAEIPVIAVDYGYNHGTPISESNPDWLCSRFTEIQDINNT